MAGGTDAPTAGALTAMARGAGCGCKLPPGALIAALAALPETPPDPRILVGRDGLDDGAVYLIDGSTALVATVDFFTPIVDDPATFGAIAATNALSDLYAMGATPTLALAVAAFPAERDPRLLAEIMAGGARAAAAAGCPVLGGHTIDDPEPKYGLCAIGTAHPDKLLRNDRGAPGDVLLLTKALGVGIVVAASRAGVDAPLEAAVDSMLASNARASRIAVEAGARCATDVTGFGLLGHLRELADASGVAARIHARRAPMLRGVLELAERGHAPGGARRSREFLEPTISIDPAVSDAAVTALVDPQTSGGLLIAASPSRAEAIERGLAPEGLAARIGTLTEGVPGRIEVLP